MVQIFQVGAIKRIILRNFLTYTHLDFQCGPKFNFVIGPNGSGKSSIVCAICLGLACPTSVMARSSKIKDFVRHGQDEAKIVLFLQGRDGEDVKITRKISADRVRNQTNSKWKLNGKTVEEKDIIQIVKELEIDLVNLCNFLPQERVVNFAKLSTNELLVETMKTIGGAEMVKQYNQLTNMGTEETMLTFTVDTQQKDLENLVQRNKDLEVDVQRFKEHEAILKKISMLEKKRPWIEYNHSRELFLQAKERKKALTDEIKKLRESNQPLLNAIRDCENKMEAYQADQEDNNEELKILNKEDNDVNKKILSADKKVEAARVALEKVDDEIDRKQKSLRRAQKELEQVEQRLLKKPDQSAIQNLKQQAQQVQKDIQAAQKELNFMDNDRFKVQNELQALVAQGNRVTDQLKSFQNENSKRFESLKQFAKDTYEATVWLRKNRHRFKKHIFDPVLLEVQIKDEAFIDVCESLLRLNYQLLFVCQCKEDYDLFMSEVNDKMNLRINAVEFSGKTLSQYQAQLPEDQLQQMGFDGYALKYFKGPEEILVALCELASIHRVPVSKRDSIDEQAAKQAFSFYIAGKTRYQWITSKYGSRQSTLKTSPITQAKNFKKQVVDQSQIDQCQQQLEQLKIKHAESKPKYDELETLYSNKQKQVSELAKKKQDLTSEIKEFTSQHNAYNNLVTKKDVLIERINQIESEPSGEEMKQQLQNEYENVLQEKFELIEKLTAVMNKWDVCLDKRLNNTIKLMQVTWEKELKEKEMNDSSGELNRKQDELKVAAQDVDVAKSNATRLLNRARSLGDPTDEEQQYFSTLPDQLDALDLMLNSERVKSEMNIDTDPQLVFMYERRQHQIEELQKKLDANTLALKEIKDKMAEIRDDWEPKVKQCVEGISEKFSRYLMKLGCAGAVQLSQDDDYSKWGIEILVKFRDNEELAPLTSHRQSGGERSVSTMMYLMSLQQFSKSPFRVVDEINQGMDPRNERLVHAQLVDTVCSEGASQYFLITPKLLPDLKYHPDMKVHVVFNAIELPTEPGWCLA